MTVATFKDSTGGEWELAISFGRAARMKREVGFDLDAASDETGGSLVAAVYGRPQALADVIWFLVREQVEAKGLTREQFEDRLTWKEADAAADALWEAVLDFTHRRRSPALKARLPEIFKRIDDAAARAAAAFDVSGSSSSAGSSPGSSGSTPGP